MKREKRCIFYSYEGDLSMLVENRSISLKAFSLNSVKNNAESITRSVLKPEKHTNQKIIFSPLANIPTLITHYFYTKNPFKQDRFLSIDILAVRIIIKNKSNDCFFNDRFFDQCRSSGDPCYVLSIIADHSAR